MNPDRALQLALNFLGPFQEAGNIFDDYIEDEGVDYEEYAAMIASLRKLLENAKTLRIELPKICDSPVRDAGPSVEADRVAPPPTDRVPPYPINAGAEGKQFDPGEHFHTTTSAAAWRDHCRFVPSPAKSLRVVAA